MYINTEALLKVSSLHPPKKSVVRGPENKQGSAVMPEFGQVVLHVAKLPTKVTNVECQVSNKSECALLNTN